MTEILILIAIVSVVIIMCIIGSVIASKLGVFDYDDDDDDDFF